jgi:hypothetical protein
MPMHWEFTALFVCWSDEHQATGVGAGSGFVELTEALNGMSVDGWDLVTAVAGAQFTGGNEAGLTLESIPHWLYFKRPKL